MCIILTNLGYSHGDLTPSERKMYLAKAKVVDKSEKIPLHGQSKLSLKKRHVSVPPSPAKSIPARSPKTATAIVNDVSKLMKFCGKEFNWDHLLDHIKVSILYCNIYSSEYYIH